MRIIAAIGVLTLTPSIGLSQVVAGDRSLGIEAATASADAAAVADWDPLIGDWLIVFEQLGSDGQVEASFEGEWNFHYVLGGTGVQDVFFLPRRTVSLPEGATRFEGTGLRVFDPTTRQWQATWADTNAQGFESWSGTSEPGRIRFWRSVDGARVEVEYRLLESGEFLWEQREAGLDGKLTVTQRVRGKRS